MADSKISALTDGGEIQSTDEFAIARSGSNRKITGEKFTSPIVDQISVTPGSSPIHDEGLLFYNSTDKTLSYYNDELDVELNICRENVTRVYNNSGATIANGAAVYISGAEGAENRATIALAQANAADTSALLGITTHEIENDSFGYVTQFGKINNINTASFSAGDAIYLSTTTPGSFQTAIPTAPDYTVFVGYVLKSDASTGRIFVTTIGNTSGTASGNATEITEFAQKGTPGTITKGQVVYVSGYDVGAGVSEVELAQSNGASTMPAVGIAIGSISNSTTGSFIVSGILRNVDTSSFTAGDELYVDPTTPGSLTNSKPTSSNKIQKIAVCLRSHASNGVLLVIGAGRSNDVPNFSAADKFWYSIAGGTVTEGDITTAGRNLIDDSTVADQRNTLGVDPTLTMTSVNTAASPVTGAVDNFYIADAVAGAITINLPTAVGISGKRIYMKKVDASAQSVTLNANGSETIDGSGSVSTTTQYDDIQIISDGINWHII